MIKQIVLLVIASAVISGVLSLSGCAPASASNVSGSVSADGVTAQGSAGQITISGT